MRIVFMGTPDFASQALENILANNFNVVGVYTQPPKPVGRGYTTQKSATHIIAEAHNIPVFYPKTLRTQDAQDELASLNPDICIVAAYGFILPQAVLDIPKLGCINIHASLLPRWRGAAPIQHAILAGDAETGITIMNMDVGMDTGDMLFKRSTPITNSTTSGSLFESLAKLGADMIVDYLNSPNTHLPEKQNDTLATMAPKITKQMGVLNWHQTATELDQHVRAFTPWPGSTTIHNEAILKIGSVTVRNDLTHNHTPGTVLSDDLTIACGQNTVLQILTVQRPGGKMLNALDFIKGYKFKAGDMFNSPELE